MVVHVIGLEKSSFYPKQNPSELVEGTWLYYTEPLGKRGTGETADKVFISKKKLASLNFELAPGQDVTIHYNRYGKVETISLEDDEIIG